MSNYRNVEIVCPKCRHRGQFQMWDSINSVISPDITQQMLTGKLFDWNCPACGETFQVTYPFLFHQMESLRLFGVGIDYEKVVKQMGIPDGYVYEYLHDIESLKRKLQLYSQNIN